MLVLSVLKEHTLETKNRVLSEGIYTSVQHQTAKAIKTGEGKGQA